jgi:LysR family transcriptional regulator, glycine cleavage system transcriptional activator
MSRRLPPLNALKAFEAVARHEHVGKASQDLNVTHSAVSHHIHVLEESLGVELFTKVGRNLKLTEAGQFLLPTVRQALDSLADAVAHVKRPVLGGRLHIACAPGFCAKWLVPRVGRFAALHPQIELLIETLAQDIDTPLPGAEVTILYGNAQWTDQWARLLTEVDSFPVCSPQWLERNPLCHPRDLLACDLLQWEGGSKFPRWLLSQGVAEEPTGKAIYFSTAHHAIDAAAAGYGVAMGDNVLAGDDLANGLLVRPFQGRLPATYEYYAVCERGARNAGMVEAFIDWLVAEFESQAQPGDRLLPADSYSRGNAD